MVKKKIPPKKKWVPQVDDSAFDESKFADPFGGAGTVSFPPPPVILSLLSVSSALVVTVLCCR